MSIKKNIYLSLGSNQGNRLKTLQKAIDKIADSIGVVIQISSVYKTKSWGFKSNDFLNICIEISTRCDYKNLWNKIKKNRRRTR